MVSGTDEHGTPVMVAADEAGVSPRELADHYNESSARTSAGSGCRTTCSHARRRENHHEVVRDVFRTLYENGLHLRADDVGAFSAATGRTLPDRYIEGTCPICGFPEARGDQCDNCGNQLDPARPDQPALEDRRQAAGLQGDDASLPRPARVQGAACRVDRAAGRLAVERPPLLARARQEPEAASRHARSRLGRAVPVAGLRGARDKRIYVWFDAVIGYLSAAIEWARNRGTPDAWRDWWQNPDARHYYFMGKDNIVFHSVIWPAQLLGYGEGGVYGAGRGRLELPYNIVSSEFLTMEGKPVQHEPRRRHLRRRLPQPLRPRPAALLPHRRRARRPRTPTSPGPSSCVATTTSLSRTGATSSTAR